MEVFAWNPKAGNETLDAFNERVAAFCTDNPVAAVDVGLLAESILLSLTLGEDAGLDSLAAVIPHVMLLTPAHRLKLEAVVGGELQRLDALDSDDNPCLPFKVSLHQITHGADDAYAGCGYAVILINGGEVELDGDGGEEGSNGQPR